MITAWRFVIRIIVFYKIRCIVRQWVNHTASHGTGIDAIDAIGVRLFPNPASSVVTIEVAEPAEVSMVDISGRTVGSWTTDGSVLKVALGQMAKGTYFVRVVSEGGIAVRKLVVK